MVNEDNVIAFRSDVTVELHRSHASDRDVVEAARVSTLGGMAGEHSIPARDAGLINYLMRDRHGSPFEHNSMTFFISAPIFVFREFHRHRAGWSYNESSGRYMELQPVFYVPDGNRKIVQQGKPGRYEFVEGTEFQRTVVDTNLRTISRDAYFAYTGMLSHGVAREIARMCLPLNTFSSMYATCNARSLMHFLALRTQDERARTPSFPQREIAMVAEKMEAEWAKLMPLTHAAFNANGRVSP